MIIKIGMTLLCTYWMYTPGMSRNDKVEVKNVETSILFQEGENVLVSYRFKEGKELGFFGKDFSKYEMTTEADLQATCKEKK